MRDSRSSATQQVSHLSRDKKKCDMSSLGHRTIPRIFLRAANLPAVNLRLWRRTSVFLQQNLQMTKERPRKRQQQRKRPRLGRFLAFSRYKFLKGCCECQKHQAVLRKLHGFLFSLFTVFLITYRFSFLSLKCDTP